MKSIASSIRRNIRHLGVARTTYRVFMEGINLCLDLRIIRIFTRDEVNPTFFETGKDVQWQFLDESQMLELARDPDNELTESLVQTALDKGDECYAGYDGEAIACFCLYTNKPTDDGGLKFHFPPDYIYGYAAFTYPTHRGRRLNAIRMNRSLREYLDRGFKGVISTIDSHNFPSLRAHLRLGIQEIGFVFVLKIGRFAWIHNSRGCRQHGISFAKPTAAAEPVPAAR